VVKSLLPLGAGHLISIAVVLGVVAAARVTIPLYALRVMAAAALIAFGIYRFVRRRHPRWVGMRVGSRDLTLWSFLMASAHGAGLMLVPFVLASPQPAMPDAHAHHMMMVDAMQVPFGMTTQWWFPVALHTAGYLLVTAALALIVYYKIGIAILRRAWFNFDLLWVGALVAMGVLTLMI
jgi:hypothetical protein